MESVFKYIMSDESYKVVEDWATAIMKRDKEIYI